MASRVLAKYKVLVEFLAKVLGENCEVVLHSIDNYENSIIAIENGNISGRKVGDSLTDLALNILKDKEKIKQDYLTNYTGKTYAEKKLKSSTYFIRDDNQEVKGMLCINVDVGKYVEARDLLNSLIGSKHNIVDAEKNKDLSEKFTTSIEDLIDSMIENFVGNSSIPPKRMTADEKKNITKQLDQKGVFLLKNSVSKVAKKLQSSEATIYRYLND